MSTEDAVDLLKQYLHLLTQTGKIVIITPQEKGFDSDPTHTEFMDFASLNNILTQVNCSVEREYSFPFPRFLGKFFTYNEFLVVGRKV